MRFDEVEFSKCPPVSGYGPGFFRIGETIHRGHVIVSPSGVFSWHGIEDVEQLLVISGRVDLVLIGTGANFTVVPEKLRECLDAEDIPHEFMTTPTACRAFNMLLSENRSIAAALMSV